MSTSGWSVRIAWKRCPSWSVNDSCAPGWGRSRQTITRDPCGQEPKLDIVSQLDDLPVGALRSVLIQCRDPSILWGVEDRGADWLGEFIAEGEPQVTAVAVISGLVRRAGRIGADQDLDHLDLRVGDLRH